MRPLFAASNSSSSSSKRAWYAWYTNRLPRNNRSLWIGLFVLITAIASLHFLIIPVLLRLHMQFGLSLWDYGFHGLYPTRHYTSFELDSPDVEVAIWDDRCSDGYIFIAPHGPPIEGSRPLILDARGNLVWTFPTDKPSTDFKVQEYRGEKFLTFWHGTSMHGHGLGSYTMLDSSYVHRYEVTAVGDFEGDIHDFRITENGTALIVIYDIKAGNLVEFDGPQNGFIYDGVFQEVDIASNELLFEWHFSHHVPFSDTYTDTLKGMGKDSISPWDPYHINTVDKDVHGNYLVSARHMHSLYSIDATTGDILWTLGGKQNEFTDGSDGRATDFAWQHDARWYDERTITLYDNAAKDFLGPITASRGMIIDIDASNRVATLKHTYSHPEGIRAHSQGNMQILPESGNAFIGWGHCAAYTEFAPDGEVLCDTHLSPSNWFQLGLVYTYRTYKNDWVGKPVTLPAATVVGNSVFVSWNGATEIEAWQLELWDGVDMQQMNFVPTGKTKKVDFETKVDLPNDMPNTYFRLVALDSQDVVLGRSALLSKHPKETLAEMLGKDIWDQMSYPVIVTTFLIVCCAALAVWGIWKKISVLVSRINIGWLRFRVQRALVKDDVEMPLMTNEHED